MSENICDSLTGTNTAQDAVDNDQEPEAETCLICFHVISSTDPLFPCTNNLCRLVAHTSCMATWLDISNVCPHCRTQLRETSQVAQAAADSDWDAEMDEAQRQLEASPEGLAEQAREQAALDEYARTEPLSLIISNIALMSDEDEAELRQLFSTHGPIELVDRFQIVFETQRAALRACRDLDGVLFQGTAMDIWHLGTYESFSPEASLEYRLPRLVKPNFDLLDLD